MAGGLTSSRKMEEDRDASRSGCWGEYVGAAGCSFGIARGGYWIRWWDEREEARGAKGAS